MCSHGLRQFASMLRRIVKNEKKKKRIPFVDTKSDTTLSTLDTPEWTTFWSWLDNSFSSSSYSCRAPRWEIFRYIFYFIQLWVLPFFRRNCSLWLSQVLHLLLPLSLTVDCFFDGRWSASSDERTFVCALMSRCSSCSLASTFYWSQKHLQRSPPYSGQLSSWIKSDVYDCKSTNTSEAFNIQTLNWSHFELFFVNSNLCEDSSASRDPPAVFFYFLSSRWPFYSAVVLVDIQVFGEALWALLPATYWNVCYDVAGIRVVNKVLNISFLIYCSCNIRCFVFYRVRLLQNVSTWMRCAKRIDLLENKFTDSFPTSVYMYLNNWK